MMKSTRVRTAFAAFAAILTIVGASSATAETLGEIPRESGCDPMIGTCFDDDRTGVAADRVARLWSDRTA